jgi:hypothetical protein
VHRSVSVIATGLTCRANDCIRGISTLEVNPTEGTSDAVLGDCACADWERLRCNVDVCPSRSSPLPPFRAGGSPRSLKRIVRVSTLSGRQLPPCFLCGQQSPRRHQLRKVISAAVLGDEAREGLSTDQGGLPCSGARRQIAAPRAEHDKV